MTDIQPQFHVFLAHNSVDKPQVRLIAEALKKFGLTTWLDEENIRPGCSFLDEIQQAIPLCKTAAIFFGVQGLGRWQKAELDVFISQCIEHQIPVIPILLPGVNEVPAELLFLRRIRWINFCESLEHDENALDLLRWGITGYKPQRYLQLNGKKPGQVPTEEALQSINNSGLSVNKSTDIQTTPSVINKQKAVELLRLLDYKQQQDCFDELIQLNTVAFFIQAPSLNVLNWLLERLIYNVPSSVKGRKFFIDFAKCLYHPDKFFSAFSSISNNLASESVIEELSKICGNETVIIVMRKLNSLDKETSEKFYDFWDSLLKKVSPNKNNDEGLPLVLLVAELENYKYKICPLKNNFKFVELNSSVIEKAINIDTFTGGKNIFNLSTLNKIQTQDVRKWLRKNEVLSFLNEVNNNINHQVSQWGEAPEDVLDSICQYVFNFENGIAEMDAEWKIK
ncbi:MAG: toll/interleukin-1 receptor domain-containing protein [Nostoc sp. LLA-1]|nr:toll/interleukin-1 receptor domain-containing protein [Cyanocohniella sp. LLY]